MVKSTPEPSYPAKWSVGGSFGRAGAGSSLFSHVQWMEHVGATSKYYVLYIDMTEVYKARGGSYGWLITNPIRCRYSAWLKNPELCLNDI